MSPLPDHDALQPVRDADDLHERDLDDELREALPEFVPGLDGP